MTVEQIIKEVAHFWNTFDLFLKTSLGVDPFIWLQVFIHMQIKLIFKQIVDHQALTSREVGEGFGRFWGSLGFKGEWGRDLSSQALIFLNGGDIVGDIVGPH